nr:MAG TPA: hypothetical protein [Caudoviricetes sp.]
MFISLKINSLSDCLFVFKVVSFYSVFLTL